MRRHGRVLAAMLGICAWQASAAGAVVLLRGPYLQNLGQTGVTIVWKTDTIAACSVAHRLYPGGVATTTSCGSGTTCTCTMSGLSSGAQYAYSPQADGVPLASEVVYHTDPGPGDPHFS